MTLFTTLLHIWHQWRERNGSNPCILYCDGLKSRTSSFHDVACSAAKVTAYLMKHGLVKQVIGLCESLEDNLVPAVIGVLEVRSAFYSISDDIGSSWLNHVITKLGIKTILCRKNGKTNITIIEKLNKFKRTTQTIEGTDFICVHLCLDDIPTRKLAEDIAYVITTSGTTGLPKIVKVPHSCIVPNILCFSKEFSLSEKDVILQASPPTFDPSIVEMFMSIHAGATLLVVPHSVKCNSALLGEVLVKHGCSVIQATPTLILNFKKDFLQSALLSSHTPLRLLALGGEKCPQTGVIQSWRGVGNRTRFYNVYGVTEVSSWATWCHITEDMLRQDHEVPLGSPIEKTSLKILDKQGNECSQGFLYIGGERACLIDDEEVLCPGLSRNSGDLVRRDELGDLWYEGREDDQVKRHGKRVSLHAIEQVFHKHFHHDFSCTVAFDKDKSQIWLFVTRTSSDVKDESSDEKDKWSDVKNVSSDVKDETSDEKDKSSDEIDKSSDEKYKSSDEKYKTSDVKTEPSDDKDKYTDEKYKTSDEKDNSSDPQKEEAVICMKDVSDVLNENLPSYYRPDGMLQVPAFPLTHHGKIDKKALLSMTNAVKSEPSFAVSVDEPIKNLLHTGEQHQCSDCGKSFSRNSYLKKHIKMHTGEKKFSCAESGKCFLDYGDLKRHKRIDTGDKPYKCSECWKCFAQNRSLKIHMKLHTGEKSFCCSECGKCFSQSGTLKKHMKIHTNDKPFSCTECGICFITSGNLQTHLRIHSGEKPYICSECGKCFSQSSHLKRHMKIHTGELPYKCSECGKCFTESSHLKRHSNVHTNDKPFSCTQCGRGFKISESLQKHLRIHSREKPYQCSECGKCFSENGNLKKHMRIHSGEQLYKCSECGKCFSENGNLKKHMRIHSGEQPYKCSECGKCFTESTSLKKHMKIHSGEKPYICSECCKCFSQSSNLKSHIKIHTGEKSFSCTECGKCFLKNSNLKKHMEIHSGELSFSCSECGKCFLKN